MKRARVLLLLVGLAVVGLCVRDASATCFPVTIYETDFSANPFPEWQIKYHADHPGVTNDSYSWTGGTLRGTMHNSYTTAVYVPLDFDSSQSWCLKVDTFIDDIQWSAGLTFGLFDEHISLDYDHVDFDRSLVDQGRVMSVSYRSGASGAGDSTQKDWSLDTWYRNVLKHDADLGTLSFQAWERDTGTPLWSSVIAGVSLPSDLDYLEARPESRVFQVWADGASRS